MTKLKRRRPAPSVEPRCKCGHGWPSHGPKHGCTFEACTCAWNFPPGRPPARMQDVMDDLGLPRVNGVDPEAAEKALQKFLRSDKGEVRPFCTHISGPYVFDPQYGVYVHSDPKCWKPSKAMYEACLRAGILGEVQSR